MANTITENALEYLGIPWWVVLIEGIMTIFLAILMLWHPFGTLTALMMVLGIYWIFTGVLGLVGIMAGLAVASRWWVGLFWSLLLVLAGLAALNQPFVTAIITQTMMIYIIAFMLIFSGSVAAFTANKRSNNPWDKWAIILLAAHVIILGIIMLFMPVMSFIIMWLLIGCLSLASGIAMVVYSFRVRSAKATV